MTESSKILKFKIKVTAFFDDPDNMYYAFGVFVCGVSIFCFHYWCSNWRQLELECWCCAQKSYICVKFKNKWTCQECDKNVLKFSKIILLIFINISR